MWKALAVWSAPALVSLRVGCETDLKQPSTSVSCVKRKEMENWLQMGTHFVGISFFLCDVHWTDFSVSCRIRC